jgi:hypothetical protein
VGLFGPSRFLDEDDENWQIETWKWMLAEFGGRDDLNKSPLVLPTREFFPPGPDGGEALAEHIFTWVKNHAGMAEWTCRLIVQPPRPDVRVSQAAYLTPVEHAPCGTFTVNEGVAEISYEAGLVNDPMGLIATFAHELAHYRLACAKTMTPGGEGLHEFATDLATVYLGFGLFGANNAFNFGASQDSGWAWARAGYLSQRAWVFALGTFMKLRGMAMEQVKPFLKGYLYSDLRTAWRHLESRHSPMRAFDATPPRG